MPAQTLVQPRFATQRGDVGDGPPPSVLRFPDLGVKRLHESLRRTEAGAVDALHMMLRFAGSSPGDKSVRICVLAIELGERLGLPRAEIRDLEFSALLHDIGFVALPADLLRKHGVLTREERRQLQRHPELGEAVLAGIPGFERVGRIVGVHHERPDGGGYPHALRGQEIPLPARILSVAETFQAMMTDRSYRSRLPLREAIERLQAGAGSRYDQKVVGLLGQDPDRFERLLTDARMQLSEHELGPQPPRPEGEN